MNTNVKDKKIDKKRQEVNLVARIKEYAESFLIFFSLTLIRVDCMTHLHILQCNSFICLYKYLVLF